jgi:ribosomal-protein-alanine N-acetyltransferase
MKLGGREVSEIKIEVINEADEDLKNAIFEIDAAAFGPDSLTRWSLPVFLHYGRVYLARLNSVPVGVAELIRDYGDPRLAYLYGFAVAPAYRGQGIGTILLQRIIEGLPGAGFNRLQLTVAPENEVARRLYQKKFGMRLVELISGYYGAAENRLLLEWNWDGFKK